MESHDIAALCDRIRTDRAGATHLREQFAMWWSDRDVAASQLLDELARRSATEPAALDALLDVIDRHGLARIGARRVLIAESDVADVEQAALAVVGLKIGQYAGAARFTTWLHQIATNEAKMLLRARGRRPSTPVAEPEPAPFVARLSTLLADRDVVVRALESLPEEFRRPLMMRELDALSYDEIAATLTVPIGTVRSRLSRGRTMLIEQLRSSLAES